MFGQFGGQNCPTSESLTSQFAFLEFPRGKFRNFKQIGNQDGLGVHSNPSFSHNRAKFMPKPKSYFNLDSVNTLRQDNTGVLGLFQSRDGVPQ